MSIKTEQMKNTLNVNSGVVTTSHLKRNGDAWDAIAEREYDAALLPKPVLDHITLYGIKAFLGDRTSDFRKLGIAASMEAQDALWALMVKGLLSAPRAAAANAIDKALIHLVAELKGQSLPWAEAQLKALPAATRTALGEKYSDRLLAIRGELATAPAGESDLDDLL